eukprot:1712915-Amphidinium_carterae.1
MMQSDHEIVLTAVRDCWLALSEASIELRSDRAIVLVALQQTSGALHYASDELLLDVSFAVDEKRWYHILRISNLSGQQAVVAVSGDDTVDKVLNEYCRRREILRIRGMRLIHGTEVIEHRREVRRWPGIRQGPEASEYQLIVSRSSKEGVIHQQQLNNSSNSNNNNNSNSNINSNNSNNNNKTTTTAAATTTTKRIQSSQGSFGTHKAKAACGASFSDSWKKRTVSGRDTPCG